MEMRIARPVSDLERSKTMYMQALQLVPLGGFKDHAGFDGVMLGPKDSDAWHLEFTHCHSHPVKPAATAEDLLVFYVPEPDAWLEKCSRMLQTGFRSVESFNPYWDQNGRTFIDPDGYRVVIQKGKFRRSGTHAATAADSSSSSSATGSASDRPLKKSKQEPASSHEAKTDTAAAAGTNNNNMGGTSYPHFVTGQFTSHAVRLPDREYSLLLDCVVKCCTDVLVLRNYGNDASALRFPVGDPAVLLRSEVLLGKRTVHPQRDWWFGCGGRMVPGESPADSVVRLLRRELGVTLRSPADGGLGSADTAHLRLRAVAHQSYVWQKRHQPPEDNGTADVAITVGVSVSARELDGLVLDRGEYSEMAWIKVADVLASKDKYHPALLRAVQGLVLEEHQTQLQKLVQAEVSTPEEVDAAARSYCGVVQAAAPATRTVAVPLS